MMNILNLLPDKLFLSLKYRYKTGFKIDWKNPKTYTEKLQWLKINDHNPEYIKLVDKYEAKQYIKNIIGEKYIIPTYGIYDRFEDINFDNLPEQFVIKCTHDSGGIIICKNKKNFDYKKAYNVINKCLKNNYFYGGREWPYKNIKPRIIVEKYMEDNSTNELRDYKFFVFEGKAELMFIASGRFSKNDTCFDFFDMNFNHLNIKNGHPNANITFEKPLKFNQMKNLAEKIGKHMKHVRVDFYIVNNEIYFGEITLYHHSGFVKFYPYEWDEFYGKKINLD